MVEDNRLSCVPCTYLIFDNIYAQGKHAEIPQLFLFPSMRYHTRSETI